jgi:hypothetical protein
MESFGLSLWKMFEADGFLSINNMEELRWRRRIVQYLSFHRDTSVLERKRCARCTIQWRSGQPGDAVTKKGLRRMALT